MCARLKIQLSCIKVCFLPSFSKFLRIYFGYFGNFYYFCSTVSYLQYDMTANSPIQKSLLRKTLC